MTGSRHTSARQERVTPKTTLIFASLVHHDSVRQRPHWLAEGLSERYRVLWLEPHVSLVHERRTQAELTRMSDTFARLRPASVLPVTGYVAPFNALSYRLTARAVRGALGELAWDVPRAIVTTFPKQLELVRALERGAASRRLPVVYDVMDDYPRFFGLGQHQVLERMHRALLARADAVTTSSESLALLVRQHTHANVSVIANGVSRGFIEACERAASSPECADFGRPIFGYVGVISRWFDFEAVTRLAQAYPNGTVVLVGPADVPLPPLPSNVKCLGRRAHDELPALLAAFDVGLVPFRHLPGIDAVNPVKVYEYWAAGLPVLGTPFTELERMGAGVVTAHPDEWPKAASALVVAGDVGAVRSRARALASTQTWELRVASLAQVVQDVAAEYTPAHGRGPHAT